MFSNTLVRRIEWGDCDPAGIVFNPNFFRFFDHCTTMLYEAAGWPKPEMVKTFGIAGVPLVGTSATFKAPCFWGDDVTITSTVTAIRRSSFEVKHELRKNGELCVESTDTRVWTIRDPDTGRLKSAAIPAEVVARFERKEG